MDEPTGGIPPSALSGALAMIKEHPELISAVASAISGSSPTETQESQNEESKGSEYPEAESASAEVPNLPIEKISEVMTVLAPMLSELGGKQVPPKEIKGSREEHRYALLCSLRPYLSEERREIVDYMLKFGKISELIKKIK